MNSCEFFKYSMLCHAAPRQNNRLSKPMSFHLSVDLRKEKGDQKRQRENL